MADTKQTIVFQVKDLVAGGSLTFREGQPSADAEILERGFGFHSVQDRSDGLKTAVRAGVLAADVIVDGDNLHPSSTDEMLVKAIWINGEAADQSMVQRLRRTTIAKIGGRVADAELLGMAAKQEKDAAKATS